MDPSEKLAATLGKLPRNTAKKLAALILDSDGEGIIQIAFIVLDGELFARLEISGGYARRLVVSAEKDAAFAEANHGGRRRWRHWHA